MTESDLTKRADLTRHAKGTGALRSRRPEYIDFLPPCNDACPAGENIQAWLDKAQAGDFEGAWRILVRDNPLPAIHGRVCYHPCEGACNRREVDDAVSIHAVERFLGDLALEPDHARQGRRQRQPSRRVPELDAHAGSMGAHARSRRFSPASSKRTIASARSPAPSTDTTVPKPH